MHRTDGAGNVGGMYSSGVPGVQEATVLTADHMNAIQEEIAGVIEASGATLDKADNTQLLTALDETYARLAQTNEFTAKNTFTNEVDANSLTVNGDFEANGTIALNNDVSVLGAVSATELIAGSPGISTTGPATIQGDLGVGSDATIDGKLTVGALEIDGVNPTSSTSIAGKLTLANTVKAFITFTADASGPNLRDGAHIASIANENANQVRVTFASSFANTYYVCSFESDNSGYEPRAITKNAAYVIVGAKDNAGNVIAIGSSAAVGVTVGMMIVGRQ